MIRTRVKFLLFLATIGLCAVAAGCPRTTPEPVVTTPNPGAPQAEETPSGPFAEGQKVFQKNNCKRCHSVGEPGPVAGGDGPKMKMGGPSLMNVGTKQTREWIIAHIRDPKSHNAKSRMPAADTAKISDAEMQSLADYLVSLKK